MANAISPGRKRIEAEMMRADADKAEAEQRHANLVKVGSLLDGYRDELMEQLRAIEAAEEAKGRTQ